MLPPRIPLFWVGRLDAASSSFIRSFPHDDDEFTLALSEQLDSVVEQLLSSCWLERVHT